MQRNSLLACSHFTPVAATLALRTPVPKAGWHACDRCCSRLNNVQASSWNYHLGSASKVDAVTRRKTGMGVNRAPSFGWLREEGLSNDRRVLDWRGADTSCSDRGQCFPASRRWRGPFRGQIISHALLMARSPQVTIPWLRAQLLPCTSPELHSQVTRQTPLLRFGLVLVRGWLLLCVSFDLLVSFIDTDPVVLLKVDLDSLPRRLRSIWSAVCCSK